MKIGSRTYLDWNATAPLRGEARAAMIAAMDVVGNPSSVHNEGRAAKALVETARGQVARAVGCLRDEVIFTSGATEAAAVLGALSGGLNVDETAHDALWAHAKGHSDDPSQRDTLAIGLANSETGVIADLPAKADDGWYYKGLTVQSLCLDVTQVIGRAPFAFSWSGADMAVLSAHKLGGPKGVGALIVRQGIEIPSLQLGGGQEMGRRSGTENIIGIAGFGAAAEAASRDLDTHVWDRVAEFRNILEKTLEDAGFPIILVGKDKKRLPNTTCVIAPGWKGETQVMQMDLAGFAISAGSACSSGKVKESRVLRAMGFSEAEARCSVRISLGPDTTEDDVMQFADVWTQAYRRHLARAT